MEPSIALHIENRLPPLTESACNQLRQNGTGPVSDSCPEAVVIGSTLQPLDNYPCTVGRALPVDAGPADNLTVWSCLKFARPGDVLLVSTEECMETSVFGDLLVGFAKNGGIAAMITDGCIRDLNGIKATGLPVYTAGTSPRAPKKNGPGKIGRNRTRHDCGLRPRWHSRFQTGIPGIDPEKTRSRQYQGSKSGAGNSRQAYPSYLDRTHD
jgi:4-hydroxy-4-methyl-2-oxoglutarate aldolase